MLVRKIYREIAGKIDCQTCANCCRVTQPILRPADTKRLSRVLGIPPAQFARQFLIPDEEPGQYRFRKNSCPFLQNNSCRHYRQRPKDCSSYPHLHQKDFVYRLIAVVENCSICPI
ncbi:MAG: YkgJ family cysteine cluster protein, partial [Deltaproteobacteria bacterium]|nr:YkgJ family cysteine cluster protein [Deltaproteobacteria bacterium]